MGRAYDANERAAIARGDFFTDAELRARPWLGKTVIADYLAKQPGHRVDPNTRPMTARQRAEIEAMVEICGYCHEPADERSALGADGRHPECSEAWAAELAARRNR